MHLWFKYSIIKPEKKSFSRCDDMPYVSGFGRNQLMCCSWDAFVDEESIARIIDAFVEHLDMKKYGVKAAAVEGRPSYDPKSLYKLYIYGSRKGIRSSRKLAESCKVNLEVKWMTGGVEPDFRTISDFRKDNIDSCHGPRKVRIMCPIENPESRVISAYKRVGRLLKSAHRMR